MGGSRDGRASRACTTERALRGQQNTLAAEKRTHDLQASLSYPPPAPSALPARPLLLAARPAIPTAQFLLAPCPQTPVVPSSKPVLLLAIAEEEYCSTRGAGRERPPASRSRRCSTWTSRDWYWKGLERREMGSSRRGGGREWRGGGRSPRLGCWSWWWRGRWCEGREWIVRGGGSSALREGVEERRPGAQRLGSRGVLEVGERSGRRAGG